MSVYKLEIEKNHLRIYVSIASHTTEYHLTKSSIKGRGFIQIINKK